MLATREDCEGLIVAATSHPVDTLASLEVRTTTPNNDWMLLLANGLARRTMMQLLEAAPIFDRALASARALAEEPRAVERVLISRAGNSALCGRLADAESDLLEALENGGRKPHGQVSHQLAAIYAMAGRFDEGFAMQTAALKWFRANNEPLWEARARQNRSKMALLVGEPGIGVRDANTAVSLYESLGHVAGAAKSLHNLGALQALCGDLRVALATFDDADARLGAIGVAIEPGFESRVEVLLLAGLAGEAFQLAITTRDLHRVNGAELLAAEATLLAARAALELGDRSRALQLAGEAHRAFVEQQREGFALHALLVTAIANPLDLDRVHEVSGRLDAAGWTQRANEARRLAAQTLLEAGRAVDARSLLEHLASRRSSRHAFRHGVAGFAGAQLALLDGYPIPIAKP